MNYLAIAGMVLGSIALLLSGVAVYRARRDWERKWAKHGRDTK